MNYCKDCKHYQENAMLCIHPNNGVSCIDGRTCPQLALVLRRNPPLCGSEGAWFEQKVETRTWRRKLQDFLDLFTRRA